MYHGNSKENHGNITEIPRKITENHGKSRKITENHGKSRKGFLRPITEIVESLMNPTWVFFVEGGVLHELGHPPFYFGRGGGGGHPKIFIKGWFFS